MVHRNGLLSELSVLEKVEQGACLPHYSPSIFAQGSPSAQTLSPDLLARGSNDQLTVEHLFVCCSFIRLTLHLLVSDVWRPHTLSLVSTLASRGQEPQLTRESTATQQAIATKQQRTHVDHNGEHTSPIRTAACA